MKTTEFATNEELAELGELFNNKPFYQVWTDYLDENKEEIDAEFREEFEDLTQAHILATAIFEAPGSYFNKEHIPAGTRYIDIIIATIAGDVVEEVWCHELEIALVNEV